MVKLRLFANLREIAGSKEVEIEGDGLQIRHALAKFAERFGERAKQCLFDQQGRLFPSVVVLLNGEATEGGPDTQVKSGDVISVLLPTAGG